MKSPGLTIGQLAAHAGVTVRAIRHYHRCGLLAEPARDASGYRRYEAQAVVDLIRIKTLADAGVPLARVQDLLGAGPGEFAAAITEIDKSLQAKIRDLTRHRRRIAELTAGERLFLPSEVVDLLDELRALGVSERGVRTERDGWILVAALSPQLIPGWVDRKRSALADPEFRQLYLACDEAFDWDPADPRLEKLAGWIVAWSARHQPGPVQPGPVQSGSVQSGSVQSGSGMTQDRAPAGMSPAIALLGAQIASASPAWQRISALGREQLRAEGPADPG
jgi:DNA-binding transcriptional MerR regulator